MSDIDYKKYATEIRCTILEMVHRAKASHVASALSIADILAVLFHSGKYELASNTHIAERDSFILSKGHACTALYATLYSAGYLTHKMIRSYGQNDSPLMHHASHKVPFVDFSTGSLGHGLPVTTGLAKGDQINQIDNHRICLLGDGELAEGSNWEALLFASHHKLQNLTVIVDCNNLQSLDTVDNTLKISPYDQKMAAFGCEPILIDGHIHSEIVSALNKKVAGKPKIILANTTKGSGVSFMENSVRWHYKNPNDDELSQALAELNSERVSQ
jgi:transketolase